MKLGTFFSGIGAVEKALRNIGVEYDLQFFSEIDKYAIKSYVAIHDEPIEKNVGDIKKLQGRNLPYCDMWVGGFPCQDISIAGKLAGFKENTRSSLGWEMIRLAREVENKPKYIIFENVRNITSKRFSPTLSLFKSDLEELGYSPYDKVLNAKDYGIPQNRQRYFLVAILGDQNYKFPQPQELRIKLKDLLEDDVDEKYYLSDKMIAFFTKNEEEQKAKGNGFRFNVTDGKVTAKAVTTRAGGRMDDNFICIKEATKKGYKEASSGDSVNLGYLNSETRRGRVGDQIAQTLTNSCNIGTVTTNLRIRKLTPLECWRLMGFDDDDFNKASRVNSNTQLYKQAGNSIVVNVLEKIASNSLIK